MPSENRMAPTYAKGLSYQETIIDMYARRWLTFAGISRALKEEHGETISVYTVKKIIKEAEVKRDTVGRKAPTKEKPRPGAKGKVGNCAYATKEELDKHADAIMRWAEAGEQFKSIVALLKEDKGILTYPQAISAFLRGNGFKGGRKQTSMSDRMKEFRPLFEKGEPSDEIARRLGISRSYVYRMSRAYRNEQANAS